MSGEMKRRLSHQEWDQMKVAYASGVGLREIARKMGIPEGSVLARAKRHGWTRQIATAKLINRPELARELAKPDAINAITPMQSAALTMRERAERHVERMARVTDKVLPYLESMEPAEILDSARNLERFDYVARRNYELEHQPPAGVLNFQMLSNKTAIQITAPGSIEPRIG